MEWNRTVWLKLSLTAAGVVVLYWALNNLNTLRTALGTIMGILSPFLVGLCIAYVLSVPMRGFEKLLFRPRKQRKGSLRLHLERFKGPICLILSILTVLLSGQIIGLIQRLPLPLPAMLDSAADKRPHSADTN